MLVSLYKNIEHLFYNMNQRASHFQLGSTQAAYGSVYTKDFIPHKETSKNNTGQLPIRGSSLQPQTNQSYFQTTSKQMMKDWGQV